MRDAFTQEEFEEYVATIRRMKESGELTRPFPVVTICRQAGARGELTAHALKQYLDASTLQTPAWHVFETNLVDIILKRNFLPETMAQSMTEDGGSLLRRLRSLFGGRPSEAELFRRTANIIRELLGIGQCIIVGRGASFLAEGMPHVLRVKLLAKEETAIRRLAKDEGISRVDATDLCHKRNAARNAFIKTYYHRNPLDHRVYDLVINTDEKRVVEVAEEIGRELLNRHVLPV